MKFELPLLQLPGNRETKKWHRIWQDLEDVLSAA